MRVSLDDSDPGYDLIRGGQVRVPWVDILLDGQIITTDVVTADTDVHIVIRYRRTADGFIAMKNGEPEWEILYGRKVEIKLKRTDTGRWPHGLPESTEA
jgi:hypothetical protein